MPTGTVKWFNPTKGYGFIEPSDGSKDAFVHISAVQQAGLQTLNEGQKVEYEVVPGQNGKEAAENITVVDEQINFSPESQLVKVVWSPGQTAFVAMPFCYKFWKQETEPGLCPFDIFQACYPAYEYFYRYTFFK